MRIIYIKETEETCDIVKRVIIKIKFFLNIVKKEICNNNIYYLPLFKDSKISKYRIKKFTNKINKLLEKDDINTIALSEWLSDNQLLKNYFFAGNINILDGRYLFKCLTYKILELIFKIKNKIIELRRNYNIN